MCGIYGSTIPYSDAVVFEKMNRIRFRGPDHTGIQRFENIVLAHNRLAIIDLDARSNQPFSYQHLHVVFNGEIYNYREIRKELEQKKHRFTTNSDTEVICAAYMQYGVECVKKFNGMFSFVIYDSKQKEFFGGRDRMGQKPFYYSLRNGHFEFGSQPAQIILNNRFEVNVGAIEEYLIWGYVPQPKSIWSDISQLPPACYCKYNTITKEFSVKRYWEIDYEWNNKFTGTYDEAKQALENLLKDAVKIRLNTDVPLGIFLSGGIDSSLVSAIAAEEVSDLKTFSIKFEEKDYDESPHAAKVADYLNTVHTTIHCNYKDGIDLIENFPTYYDEPFADPSAIPTMLLSKHTSQHVTVALSGDAGDETFLGYQRYKWIKQIEPLFRTPNSFRKLLANCINLSSSYKHKLISLGIASPSIEDLYLKMFDNMDNSWIQNPDLYKLNVNNYYLNHFSKPLLERISDFDIKTYLTGEINTKVDRASMAFSLEARAPLIDFRIVDFARSLPTEFKFQGGNQKRILKDILFDKIPSSYFNRPKAGLTMPFRHWFRDELKEYVLDNLTQEKLKNIPGIHVKRTEEIINEHMTGKWNRYPQIWKLLVISQWLAKNKQKSPIAYA